MEVLLGLLLQYIVYLIQIFDSLVLLHHSLFDVRFNSLLLLHYSLCNSEIVLSILVKQQNS